MWHPQVRTDISALVLGGRISKEATEAELKKMRSLVLRGTAVAVKSTPTAALEGLMGIESLAKSKFIVKCYNTLNNLTEEWRLSCSGPLETRRSGAMKLQDYLWSFRARQLIGGIERAVGIYHAQIKDRFRLCGKENNKEVWRKAENCSQAKVFIG